MLFFLTFGCTILYFGKALFMPLCFSLQISLALYPVCKWFQKFGLGKSMSIIISLLILLFLIFGLLTLLMSQILEFIKEWDVFQNKIQKTIFEINLYLNEKYEISNETQFNFIKNTIGNSSGQIFVFIQNMATSLSESLFFFGMIPIFSALILYYRQLLIKVLCEVFPQEEKSFIVKILTQTIKEYYNFIKGMLLVYLIVGILNSIGLFIIGIPHPVLFGFVASILTFIPYVGIIVSSLLPIIISWITYNSVWYPIGVIAVFTIVQILEAYVIFPFAVGNKLKINSLAILMIIIAGGILWGPIGMILFIPMTSILKLIASQTDKLKIIAILLGDEKK